MVDILKTTFSNSLFLHESRCNISNSLKSVSTGLINNMPALVQIMAWHRTGHKPLSESMMAWRICPSISLSESIDKVNAELLWIRFLWITLNESRCKPFLSKCFILFVVRDLSSATCGQICLGWVDHCVKHFYNGTTESCRRMIKPVKSWSIWSQTELRSSRDEYISVPE